MNKILVPTDFSDCANTAGNVALELAQKFGSEVHFLHISDTPVTWLNLPLEKENLYPEAKSRIAHAKVELLKWQRTAEKSNIKAETFIVYDSDFSEIIKHINHHKHDLVIMGSHGSAGIKEIIGSNTQKLIRTSPVPVYVVKGNESEVKHTDIVCASDFTRESYNALEVMRGFSSTFNSKIHFLYVNVPYNFKESDEIETLASNAMASLGMTNYSFNVYNALNVERGILNFSSKIKADLIVMTTQGRHGISQLLSPSITEKVANHADVSVLSIGQHYKVK